MADALRNTEIDIWKNTLYRSSTMCRDGYGIAPIVKILEGPKEAAVTSAAADLVRAVALNNDANKNAVREAWAVPQLVKLLGPEVSLDLTRCIRTPADLNAVLDLFPALCLCRRPFA